VLVRIGTKKEPGDLVDALIECHGRIKTFAALARRLGEGAGLGAEEVREAAARVRRYFSDALPRHVADEDLSILPRLRGRDRAVDQALDRMHREHREHERPLASLLDCCARLEADPAALASLGPDLAETAEALERAFLSHLDSEERVVFPALRALCTPAERDAIFAELRDRRAPESRRS
jgi:iron-sulfur cluster repair protein YtfE (RIC family)